MAKRGQVTLEAVRIMASRTEKLKMGTGLLDSCKLSKVSAHIVKL